MRVGTLYAVLRLETGAFNAALDRSESRMARFFGLVKAGAVIAASALVGVVAGSVVAAASFEKHMNAALAIMGDVTEKQRKELEDSARAVAKTTLFSANEAADAYYYLASAGYTAAQSIKLLPVVAQYAQAGLQNMAEATEQLSDAQTTMGLRSDDAVQNMENMQRVSDVLTRAGVESNATIEQLAKALTTKAGASFRVFGKDIEEAVAVLEVFANRGVKGAQAGTALSIVLRELITKAIKNKEEFKDFGIAVFDAAGNIRNMADIIKDFEDAMVGMSSEEKKAMLITLGLTDRSNAFLLTLIGSSEQIREYEAGLRSASGYTRDVAEKQLASFTSQLTIMWHKIVDVGITIGQKLLPWLTKVVTAIGNWFDANNELAGQITEKVIGTLVDLGKILREDVFPWIRKVAEFAGRVADRLFEWYDTNKKLIEQLKNFGLEAFVRGLEVIADFLETDSASIVAALLAIAGAVAILNFALSMNPVLAAILLIITAVGVLALAWENNWGDIQGKTAEVWGIIEPIVKGIGDALRNVGEVVLPALAAAWRWISDDVIPVVQAVWEGFSTWVRDNAPLIGEILGKVWAGVVEGAELVGSVVATVWPAVAGFVGWLVSWAAPMLGGVLSFLLEVVKKVVEGIGLVWEIIKGVWEGVTTLMGAVSDVFDVIAATIGFAVEGIIGSIAIVVEKIGAAIQWLREFLGLADQVQDMTLRQEGDRNIIPIAPGVHVLPPPGWNNPTPSPTPAPRPNPAPNTGFLPNFAVGVHNFRGGLAMVGESGPELVRLPRGSDVFPSGTGPGGGGGGLTIAGNINIEINGVGGDVTPGAARRFAQMIHDELANTLQEQSARFANRPRVLLG